MSSQPSANPSTNGTNLRIAFAAASPIYAHVFQAMWATEKKSSNVHFAAEVANGDRDAVRRIFESEGENGPADIAVCDPMCLAERVLPRLIQGQRDVSQDAVIVGIVLCRPALWATAPKWLAQQLVTNSKAAPECFYHYLAIDKHRRERCLVHATSRREGNIDDIATYSSSTATHIVNYFVGSERKYWDVKNPSSFQSVDAIHREIDDTATKQTAAKLPSKLYVVCHPLEEFRRLADQRSGVDPVPFGFHRSEFIPDFPFTAVLASSRCLRDRQKRKAIRQLLESLQLIANEVCDLERMPNSLGSGHDSHKAAENAVQNGFSVFWKIAAERPELLSLLSQSRDYEQTKKAYFDFCGKFFVRHPPLSHPVPKCVAPRLCDAWLQNGWAFSWRQLWRLDAHTDRDPLRVLEAISSSYLGQPGFWGRASWFARSAWWSFKRWTRRADALWLGFAGAAVVTMLLLVPWSKLISLLSIAQPSAATASSASGNPIKEFINKDVGITGLVMIVLAIVFGSSAYLWRDWRRSKGR